MSELFPNPVPAQPPREDARDLQSRLYRDIGIAAVEAALFAPDLLLAEINQRRGAETRILPFPAKAA
ncbi:hypothetical protein GJ654_13075 [Rhodoblastus acidophilus]|jgi:hypothetical protein|uniref:Uncharacterized protein n=1 Tax=Rhodoblastus acidophilus TaxID=1074 RepID=A0A6N8DN64_RHOAC|nr:hypothetical protein [Rhodoblastus acidophilus]MCW2275525.1 hypothetical protein [Rhodoblastus acidophilus]MTV31919.1 hypothetical protein [Rhodoblastus acidophilus]